jgi:hypothetical protein
MNTEADLNAFGIMLHWSGNMENKFTPLNCFFKLIRIVYISLEQY